MVDRRTIPTGVLTTRVRAAAMAVALLGRYDRPFGARIAIRVAERRAGTRRDGCRAQQRPPNKALQLTSGATCWRRAPMRRFAPPLGARGLIQSPLAAERRCSTDGIAVCGAGSDLALFGPTGGEGSACHVACWAKGAGPRPCGWTGAGAVPAIAA